jgi:flagellar hook protein FlgE
MMRSLFSGVSGLKVHQTKMDVIGNNIANVNTIGFKASSVNFSDVLYQTTQHASGPNADTGTTGRNAKQIGLGANVASITASMTTPGASQRTDNPFDVMIEGDSFFIVNSGGSNYFTKAGAFGVDEFGTLCTSTGASVMGWQVDPNDPTKTIADAVCCN